MGGVTVFLDLLFLGAIRMQTEGKGVSGWRARWFPVRFPFERD